ncbi:capsular exopolysaccharide synthesis family protein [Cytobacillus eiseniae]|uniref:non-specific protein-tyrosine kinase n=1 Tax=Cytobacillus eiseniae TaxID=762947 RepID=A0ABS4RG39_9BACI|nr:CpsD/CapB family tyrosine-protein kinase [Cytobacillus eiseniae]MBP2241870.1 capsular exopolysaccharide synthesis family protein [Cytobacillus eiseniae]
MSRKLKRKNSIPLITFNQPKGAISEQYRLIRTNIEFSSVDQEIKLISVTSPEPADGKSTTAANLAIILSQQGKQVLLVDADLRKPSIHFTFNVSNIDGLTNVLVKKEPLENVLSNSYIPNLCLLTSGPLPPNPSELLNSKMMDQLLRELRNKFDYVIFDTPPVLAVTDPQILANKCDGVVFVIYSGKTTKERAIKAKELLEKAKSQLLGVVVNGVDSKKNDYYGQYG